MSDEYGSDEITVESLLSSVDDDTPEDTENELDMDALLKMGEEEEDQGQQDTTVAKAGPSGVKKASVGDGNVAEVDLTVRSFAPITKYFEDKANPVFDDPAYYKTCLGNEGQTAQRLHQLLLKYLNCADKKDKTVYRQQMVSAYWNFLNTLAPKMANTRLPLCKRLAMRYGVVLPSLFSPEQKDFFSKAILDNYTGEPILYMDEWIREIAVGKMKPSTTDEVATKGQGPAAQQSKLNEKIGKQNGKIQSTESIVSMKESQRANLEESLKSKVKDLCVHEPIYNLENHFHTYNEAQKRLIGEMTVIFRDLQRLDKELERNIAELLEAKGEVDKIRDEQAMLAAQSGEDTQSVSKEEIVGEMGTLRQMAKMTCGRQGNQFPVLTREFCHSTQNSTGFRENVIRELAWIESIDPNCFVRIHKNMPNRIVPYTLLVPSYGDRGFCWEPFDRYNRITSRGRIAVPMYARDLKIACITAVADLRWQVAKEKASFDWMSEGLTGQYYQWIDAQKLKGDLKQFFIEDYILWITKESTGAQKLPKEVRAIFWRFMPFPQEMKEKLKMMSLTYQELYQRDVNRSMSDGY